MGNTNIFKKCQKYTSKTLFSASFVGLFEQLISDFLSFTLASKNSHKMGINWPTDMFHHSKESLDQGESDRTCFGRLRTL